MMRALGLFGLLTVALLAVLSVRLELRLAPMTFDQHGSAVTFGVPDTTVPPAASPCSPVGPVTSRSGTNYFQVVGLSRCSGSVSLRIYDAQGREASLISTPAVGRVSVEGLAPFDVVYPNPPFTVSRFTVSVSARAPRTSTTTCRLAAPFDARMRSTLYEVTGAITCSGATEATFVRVVALFFDRGDQPLGIGQDLSVQRRIAPDTSVPFEVRFGSDDVPASVVARAQVFIDWD